MANYLKLFKNHEDYIRYKESVSIMPNISHCIKDIELHTDECVPSVVYELIGVPSYPSTISAVDESFDLSFSYKKTTNTIACSTIVTMGSDTVNVYVGENTSTENDRVISDTFNYNGLLIPYTVTQSKLCVEQTTYELNGTPSYPSEIEGDTTAFTLSFNYNRIDTDDECVEQITTGNQTTSIVVGENTTSENRTITGNYEFNGLDVPYTVVQKKMCTPDTAYELINTPSYPTEVEGDVTAFTLSFDYRRTDYDTHCSQSSTTGSDSTTIIIGENETGADRTISSAYTYNGINVPYTVLQKKLCTVSTVYEQIGNATYPSEIECDDSTFNLSFDYRVTNTDKYCNQTVTTGSETTVITVGENMTSENRTISDSYPYHGINVAYTVLQKKRCTVSSVYELVGNPTYPSAIDGNVTSFNLSFNYKKTDTDMYCNQTVTNSSDTVSVYVGENTTAQDRTITDSYDYHGMSVPYSVLQRKQCSVGTFYELIGTPTYPSEIEGDVSTFTLSFDYKMIVTNDQCQQTVTTGSDSTVINVGINPNTGVSRTISDAYDYHGMSVPYTVTQKKMCVVGSEYEQIGSATYPSEIEYNVTSFTLSFNYRKTDTDKYCGQTATTGSNSTVITVGENPLYEDKTISSSYTYNGMSIAYSLTQKKRNHYQVTGVFNVTNTGSNTKIVDGTNLVDCVEIDNTVYRTVNSGFTFSTTGEHTVKYSLKNVTETGFGLLDDCDNLVNVTVEEGISGISQNSFSNCSNLSGVTLPESTKIIGNAAFMMDTNLANLNNNTQYYTRVVIPSGVTAIEANAFSSCQSIRTVNTSLCILLTSIGESAFALCTALSNFIIPSGVTTIERETFEGCTNLTTIYIHTGITSIGEEAFRSSGLIDVDIHNGVTSIGQRAFMDCSSLTRVDMRPLTPPTLGSYAFDNNAAGRVIYVPCDSFEVYKTANNWSRYQNSMFPIGCPLVATFNVTSTSEPTKLKNSFAGTNVYSMEIDGTVLPDVVNEYAFNTTGMHTVKYSIWSLKIANGLFSGCTELYSIVSFPTALNEIGNDAFRGCSSLTGVTIPDSVTTIGTLVFSDCGSMLRAEIGSGVTSDMDYTFSRCSGLTSCTFAQGVQISAFTATFSDCTSLQNTSIPDSVTHIGGVSFSRCGSITSITIPNGVTTIGSGAFEYCSGLTSIAIPSAVESIGDSAFYYCRAITSCTIGQNSRLTTIGTNAFSNCTSLESINLQEGLTNIGSYAFYYCENLLSIYIPTTLTEINDYTFQGCQSLTALTFPDSITAIKNQSFHLCKGLTNISVGTGITSIELNAFLGCSNLISVTIAATTPPSLGASAFHNNASGRKFYVPSGSVTAYQSATDWYEYRNDVEAIP